MKNIIKNLQSLKEIKPRQEWVAQNRQLLLSQLRAQKETGLAPVESNGLKSLQIFLPQHIGSAILKPVGVLLMITMVLGGGYASVSASQGSLPGDVLYPVKLTSEKMQLTFTSDQKEIAQLHIDFAEKRLDEFSQITKKEDPKTEKKSKNAKKTISRYNDEIKEVSKTLEDVKANNSAKEVVLMAKKVNEKTEEFSKVLAEKKQDVPEINNEIKEAISISNETGEKAVSMIIEKHEAGESELPDSEVVKTIENKMNETKEKISNIENQLKTTAESAENQSVSPVEEVKIEETNTDTQAVQDNNTETTTAETVNNEQTNTLAKDAGSTDPKKAIATLMEAEKLLQKGELTNAFEKVKETNKLVQSVEDNLESEANATPVTPTEPAATEDQTPAVPEQAENVTSVPTDIGTSTVNTNVDNTAKKVENNETIIPKTAN